MVTVGWPPDRDEISVVLLVKPRLGEATEQWEFGTLVAEGIIHIFVRLITSYFEGAFLRSLERGDLTLAYQSFIYLKSVRQLPVTILGGGNLTVFFQNLPDLFFNHHPVVFGPVLVLRVLLEGFPDSDRP